MDNHGSSMDSLWISIDNPWISMDYPWISMDHPWIISGNPLIIHGNPWIIHGYPKRIHGDPWISMDILGFRGHGKPWNRRWGGRAPPSARALCDKICGDASGTSTCQKLMERPQPMN